MAVVTQQIWGRPPGEMWAYLVLLATICVFYNLRSYIRNVRFITGLDGPPSVPLFGNVNLLVGDNVIHQMTHESLNYGRIFRIWLACIPFVVVLEPEDVQRVLSSPKHSRKIHLYKLLDNFLGRGLITRDVETWRVHRRILQPAFHHQMLEKFSHRFADSANRLMCKFLERSGQSINITSFINDSVYDILNETVLGITPASRRTNEMIEDDLPFRKGQVMIPYRLARPWLLINWIYRLTSAGRQEEKQRRDLFDACYKMMKQKREDLRNGGLENASASLLEYMVEVNERNPCFTDEDIVEECCTFMLAGQDSVGTATAMTIFLLANHPEWQDRCSEEIDRIFGEDCRSPTMTDFREMRCLEMCIKEALRLYPSVPMFARLLGEDVKIGKHVIPAGCGVFVLPYCTHRLPNHFPDPHSFNPERFNPKNSERMHPYAYLPFSAGPRNCIGYKFAMLEMKSMISAILRRCRLESVPGKEQVQPKFRMTIRAHGGLWVKIAAREK